VTEANCHSTLPRSQTCYCTSIDGTDLQVKLIRATSVDPADVDDSFTAKKLIQRAVRAASMHAQAGLFDAD
jgi:hypothetical protein